MSGAASGLGAIPGSPSIPWGRRGSWGRPQDPQSLARGWRASIGLHGERTTLPACSRGGTRDSSRLGGLGAPR